MKFTIITVSFNSANTIVETIKSVLAQDYKNIEYIIIDGASTDGTLEIINQYSSQITKIISEKDAGIYDAMNKGLAAATGDIVGILNSDDLFHNTTVLSTIIQHFNPTIDCIATDVEIFSTVPSNVLRYYSCTRWKKWMFRFGHQPPHPGFYVRNSVYKKYGFFNITYKLAADFDMLLRLIMKNKCPTLFLPIVSVSMRSGGESQKSFKNIQKANREVNHALNNNGYFSLPFFIWLKYPIKIFQYLLK